ncbi:MAG: hypothetical protein ACRDNZ_05275 [Streptosporangiaceae bacterium]
MSPAMFWSRSTRYEYELWRRNRRRRRLTFVLAVVVALAAIASIDRHDHQHTHHQHHPARHHTTQRATPRPGTRTPGAPSSALASAGTGLRWTSFHGIALPSSPHGGPRRTRNGLAWGFADTPRGALLAAVNIAVRTAAQWGPPVYQPTITRQVTGPAQHQLLNADASQYDALRAAAHVRNGHPAGRGYAVEAAYRFTTYTPARATVVIVAEGPGASSTVMAATKIRLTWRHGDWRVIAPPHGNWTAAATAVSSLSGYVTFTSAR